MTIQKHDLVQGSPAWHKFRAEHFGASEASAMLGISPYTTRDELLFQKKTGIIQEVSAGTQKVFDKGHAVEAAARPIVEQMIGEDLSPVTYSNGMLSASCDGISFMGDVAWENKQMNQADFELVKNNQLPEKHWSQCQQVLHCTGAEKLFFTISDGTESGTVGMWVYPDEKLIKSLIVGWEQFAKDLESYVPPVHVEKVVAETVQALPVPSVVVRGEITASNLTEITPKFDAYLQSINTELSTDQDFADAEANAKNCRETAKRIEALQENIIAQMVSVNEVNSTLDSYKAAFNKVGLQLEKAVKEQKETLKMAAIMKAKTEYSDFVNKLNENCAVLLHRHLVAPDFAAAIKGVKTITSMQSRINDALANGKAQATTFANEVKAKLEFISASIAGYEHLINVPELATKELDYIKLFIQQVKDAEDQRKAAHEAAIKQRAEDEARAKVEAEAKVTMTQEISVASEASANVTAASIPVAPRQPTADEIINLVSKTYMVTKPVAHGWLIKSFSELKAA